MKILQFAFSEDLPVNRYIPHNYAQNFITYTGTHDNNTVRGWYRHDTDDDMRRRIEEYTGRALTEDDMPWMMCKLVYSSVAKTVIIPLQDLLGLDEMARMNTPASGDNNWQWRLLPGQLTQQAQQQLREWTKMYNRR
ncbi:MAG: 4-alpha-glucanotransferase [Chitinophagaceae bacterium]|nr:4-alpha-glucanotransferase [Chitinophagaceae bacterium]